MAHLISVQEMPCQYCGIIGVIKYWSCGCTTVKYPEHTSRCNRPQEGYFNVYKESCGRSGKPVNH
jgi:hypothetical protein